MSREFAVKQNDFGRLLSREEFLWKYFHSRLRYRVPAHENGFVYVEILGADRTESDNAERYIRSYLEPKHSVSINSSPKSKEILFNENFLNRLMKEYLVHIDIEEEATSYRISFQSLMMTVLYFAIDAFDKYVSTNGANDPTISSDVEKKLEKLYDTSECGLSIVKEQDQIDEERRRSGRAGDDDELDQKNFRARQEPPLKIAYPGAESQARQSKLEDFVKPHQRKSKKRPKGTANNDERAENELAEELRQKLKGRNLRPIIMDGANIGRTYGQTEFSSRGIQLAVDLFHSFGYPDSQIVVIVPAHYLSKDPDGVFQELIRRKILHKAFHQTIEDERKRFYDDRLIVDIAVVRKGVILSNDFYRDLSQDSGDAVRKAIRERLLCYRFIGDDLLLPNPVFEGGARLEDFLSK